MNPILLAGSLIVTLALISYSIAIISEQRTGLISRRVILFLTAGLVLDITATIFMIAGSPNSPFTFHGFVGYSALTVMVIETLLIWKHYRRSGLNSRVPGRVHLYSRFAYIWWVLAYITGALLVALK
jgi:hypothetical protein